MLMRLFFVGGLGSIAGLRFNVGGGLQLSKNLHEKLEVREDSSWPNFDPPHVIFERAQKKANEIYGKHVERVNKAAQRAREIAKDVERKIRDALTAKKRKEEQKKREQEVRKKEKEAEERAKEAEKAVKKAEKEAERAKKKEAKAAKKAAKAAEAAAKKSDRKAAAKKAVEDAKALAKKVVDALHEKTSQAKEAVKDLKTYFNFVRDEEKVAHVEEEKAKKAIKEAEKEEKEAEKEEKKAEKEAEEEKKKAEKEAKKMKKEMQKAEEELKKAAAQTQHKYVKTPPMPEKDAWAHQCDDLSGLVSPYYVAKEGELTQVVCVPGQCKGKLGRSSDNAVSTAAQCTLENMEDSCCTDKITGPCGGGALPCVLGEVSSIEQYQTGAVAEAKEEDLQDVADDCQGKAGGKGPEADFVSRIPAVTSDEP